MIRMLDPIRSVMAHLTTAVVSVTVAVFLMTAFAPWEGYTKAAIAGHEAKPVALDSMTTRVTYHCVSPEGREVLSPAVVTLCEYVESPDRALSADLGGFKHAFEFDLHAGDPTFHLTHEYIDRKER